MRGPWPGCGRSPLALVVQRQRGAHGATAAATQDDSEVLTWVEFTKRLGHKSAMETLDTYGHLWPDSEESTRAAVERVLGPTLGTLAGRSATLTPLG